MVTWVVSRLVFFNRFKKMGSITVILPFFFFQCLVSLIPVYDTKP